jgi:Peroxidase
MHISSSKRSALLVPLWLMGAVVLVYLVLVSQSSFLVEACPHLNRAIQHQNNDEVQSSPAAVPVAFNPHTIAAASDAVQNRRTTRRLKSDTDNNRLSTAMHGRRRLTVFNGSLSRLFLKFANLFDFWDIIPAPKPTSAAEAVAGARKRIAELIDKNDDNTLVAKLLRLSFHDCVGGCDGCVDLANPDNFGLDIPINALDQVVSRNKEFLTTADVWALGGLVAAQESQSNTNEAFVTKFVQRPDCPGGNRRAGPNRQLPSAQLTTSGLLDFFNATFGFTARETVAAMGGHTLYVLCRVLWIVSSVLAVSTRPLLWSDVRRAVLTLFLFIVPVRICCTNTGAGPVRRIRALTDRAVGVRDGINSTTITTRNSCAMVASRQTLRWNCKTMPTIRPFPINSCGEKWVVGVAHSCSMPTWHWPLTCKAMPIPPMAPSLVP